METGQHADPPASAASCQANDLLCGGRSVLLWCLPAAALIAGLWWSSLRPWLWVPAFLVMGGACLANAARCGRVHCYFTGPLFLLAAAYVVLAEFRLVPMNPGIFLDIVVVMTGLGYLSELVLGRYRKRA